MALTLFNRMGHTNRRLQQINAIPGGVIIVRGAIKTEEVPACFGITDGQEMTPGVSMTNVRVQDFLIFTQDYIVEGEVSRPLVDDQIWVPREAYIDLARMEFFGEHLKFVIRGHGFDESYFLFITSDRSRMRIHTSRHH